MKPSNNKDYNGDFERLAGKWNEQAAEKKTPAYFLNFFAGNGQLDNTAELKELYPRIETLLDAQDFTQEQKDELKNNFLEVIQPELKKDYTPYNVDTFIKDVKDFDPSKEFAPEGMENVIFQHGTFNLIAARPSRGKTTLAISLLTDALNNANLKKQNTPVLFLTFEESNKQIYTRIFNNLLFRNALKSGTVKQIQSKRPRLQLWDTLKDPGKPDNETMAYYTEQVKNQVIEYEQSRRLQVIDCGGKTISAIENLLTFNKNAVVFIDYATLIRQDAAESTTRYEDFADISVRLVESAKTNNQIIIAAAQLRRLGEGATDSDIPETLNDTQLKDCGQFEQDANTIIALGRNTSFKDKEQAEHDQGEPLYFWKLLKNRDGGGVNKSYLFDTKNLSMGFSLLQSTDTPADFLDNQTKKTKQPKDTEQKNTDKKPNSLADIANGAW